MILTPLWSIFGFCFHKTLFLYSFFKTFFFCSSLLCCRKNFRQRSNIDSKVVILNFQTVEPLYGYPLEFELSANCLKKIVICTLLRIILTFFFPVYTVGSSCNRKYHCEHIKIVPEYLWDSMLHLKSLLYAATGLHNATEKKSQVP